MSVCGNHVVAFMDSIDDTSVECSVSITVNKTGTCFKLDYKWRTISGDKMFQNNPSFPFVKNCADEDNDDASGVIVAKNDMTTQMIRFLVMPDAELRLVCGFGTESDYRAKIIRALATMWD